MSYILEFQHTAARRRLDRQEIRRGSTSCFNTQPPEGGWLFKLVIEFQIGCFNTQPPEGGWYIHEEQKAINALFQHTAARRRLDYQHLRTVCLSRVSTHSRPKAAGGAETQNLPAFTSFNTQPPEGGWDGKPGADGKPGVSTHSRPKAAGTRVRNDCKRYRRFNTQPPEGGWDDKPKEDDKPKVSTHSRPKAAGSNIA